MSTTSRTNTGRLELDNANNNTLADVMKKMKAGKMASVIKVTFVGLTSAAAQDITTSAAKAAISAISGYALETAENLPPIGEVITLRPTAGSAGALARYVGDAAVTPTTTVAALSDDGKTLTFEAAVTAFILTYRPRSALDLTAIYPPVT